MLNFSCADYTFPLLSASQALALIRLLDVPAVDIGLFARSTHFRPDAVLRNVKVSAEELSRQLQNHNLSAADVFVQFGDEPSTLSVNDPHASLREINRDLFLRAVDFTAALECRHITGLPGVWHAGRSRETSFDLAALEAQWRTRVCKSAGLTYSIEPHIESICADPASTMRLLKAVPELTLTLDYGHFVASGFASAQVDVLAAYASHIHVRGGCPGKLQCAVASNTIDFGSMLQQLHTCHYRGSLALEYVWIEWQGCNQTDNISETLLLKQLLSSFGTGYPQVEVSSFSTF